MSVHRFDWRGPAVTLDLVNADGGAGEFWFETLADGWALGSPQAVKVVAQSLMKDGADTRIDHYENRFVPFRVVVCGPDLAALANGEAALALQCGERRTELCWTPPDIFGATTVFTVVAATMDPVPDDFAEIRPGVKRRAYDVTLECLPFARSATKAVESFPPGAVSPTLTLIDAFTAPNAGWSATASATSVSLGSGTFDGDAFLQASTGVTSEPSTTVVSRAATVTTLAYTSVTYGGTTPPTLVLGGVSYGAIAVENISIVQTRMRYWYATGAGSGRALSFRMSTGAGDGGRAYRFFDVSTSADIPQGVARSVTIRGSMRAECDVSVSASGATLGPTLVVTGPLIGRYNPMIDTGTFGGSSDYFSAPAGAYAVLVVFAAAAPVGTVVTVGSLTKKIRTTDKFQTIGTVHVGALRGGGSQTQRFTLNNLAGIAGSMFLVPLDDDHSVTAGEYAFKRLWLQSPDLIEPLGGVFAGTSADGSDAAPAWTSTRRHRTHRMAPRVTGVYVFPVDATVGAEYYPAHHTYASE